MPNFPLSKQVKIVIASMALHNFIRQDQEFWPFDGDEELLRTTKSESLMEETNEEHSPSSFNIHEMDWERDQIATLFMHH